MRLEWLEDILAVIETGSFAQAAERRLLTQSAFSRRIRQIEAHVGAELFDRTRKPVELRRVVRERHARIRELADGLQALRGEFQRSGRESGNRIVIAAQHSITTAIAPGLVARLGAESDDIALRLRSANRDDCHLLMLARQADIALVYDSPADPLPAPQGFVERRVVGHDMLRPVAGPALAARVAEAGETGAPLPVIAYPADVFLGRVMARGGAIGANAPRPRRIAAETALTLAALNLAEAGAGVAWLPGSLAADPLRRGALVGLDAVLPALPLTVVALRLVGSENPAEARAWAALCAGALVPGEADGAPPATPDG